MPAFLLSPFTKLGALGLLILGLLCYRSYLLHEVKVARAEAQHYQLQVQLDSTSINNLEQRIDEQNKAFSLLSRQSEDLKEKLHSKERQVSQTEKRLEAQSRNQVLSIEKTPIPNGCEEAIKWANQEAHSLSSW